MCCHTSQSTDVSFPQTRIRLRDFDVYSVSVGIVGTDLAKPKTVTKAAKTAIVRTDDGSVGAILSINS